MLYDENTRFLMFLSEYDQSDKLEKSFHLLKSQKLVRDYGLKGLIKYGVLVKNEGLQNYKLLGNEEK